MNAAHGMKKKKKRQNLWIADLTEQTLLLPKQLYQLQVSKPQRKPSASSLPEAWTPTWNRGAEGHKDHGGDRVFEADGAAEMGGQVPGDSRQDTDEGNRHEKAGPAVPVLGGRDKGEKDFPENSQEVHDVIEAGWQALFAALFLIIITWQRQNRWTRCH